MANVQCRNCAEYGHMNKDYPWGRSRIFPSSRVKCSNCQEMGHYKSTCSNPPVDEDDACGLDNAGFNNAGFNNGGFDNGAVNIGDADAADGDWGSASARHRLQSISVSTAILARPAASTCSQLEHQIQPTILTPTSILNNNKFANSTRNNNTKQRSQQDRHLKIMR
ncbi:hypothetical protein B0T22DRAFT_177130 [Podospora appendiculata]|uniref:CCHC-type domain-containing protein n=1 Tax=Podospora appendiculata TaxID=314037 RepID=A0AAE0XBS3_9PEZI|nr:hypothetical protein B0T22DRAFT_177130 [Podospora appendiculata]